MRRRPTPGTAVLAIAVVTALAATAAACADARPRAAAPTSAPTPSPGVSRSAAPTTPPGAWLTGREGPTGPVVAVKIDNVPGARTLQLGLDDAAVVYQEVVEGGATRFCAIFVGALGTEVGPVRSARDTDLELLAQYGRVVFGFSGANSEVLAHVEAANVLPVPQGRAAGDYETRGRRAEAYNFFTTPARLAGAAGGEATRVKDIGLRFGPLPAGGRLVRSAVATFSPYSRDTLEWDRTRRGWRITQDGQPVVTAGGRLVAPANVIVQFVPVRPGGYVDALGNDSPVSRSVGRGRAAVLRNGRVFGATWWRRTATAGTRLLDSAGRDVRLDPGRTWVLLVPGTTQLALT